MMKNLIEQSTNKIKLYFDGASRNNPGHAGAGWIVYTPTGKELEGSVYLGIKTNNQAEYLALLKALEFIEINNLNYAKLEVCGDSELIIKQLTGEYKIKSTKLKPLYEQVQDKFQAFQTVTFTWVPRSENSTADKLANKVIDIKLDQLAAKQE